MSKSKSIIWSVHFKDEDGEEVLSHVVMTMEQAKELIEKFIERGVEVTLRNISEPSLENDDLSVPLEHDEQLFKECT